MTEAHARLVDRVPVVSREELLAHLAPPPQFQDVRLSTYRPDPHHASQAEALAAVTAFVTGLGRPRRPGRWTLRRRAPGGGETIGVYLDGGFGVGKTHLLASAWHEAPQPKVYLSFTQLTQLVGAVGFAAVAERLRTATLVCIDEFELDDPGDTVMVSSLLNRAASGDVRFAVTSNTLPGALGEGRFDTTDFVREIQSLADRFTSVRVDGPDYRHRDAAPVARCVDPSQLEKAARDTPRSTSDAFVPLIQHLRDIHPSRYAALVDGVSLVCLRDVTTLHDQSDALRLVALVDRLYEQQIPIVASGTRLDLVFEPSILQGGYRKKYLRAISRLSALSRLTTSPVGL